MFQKKPDEGGNIPSAADMDMNRDRPDINPEGANKSIYDRVCPCLSWKVLLPYFDVTTHDIKKRVMGSLIPFNQKFY